MTSLEPTRGDRVERFVAAIDGYEPASLEKHADAFRVFSRVVSRTLDGRYLDRHPPEELLPDLEHLMGMGLRRAPDEIKVRIDTLGANGDTRAVITTCMADQHFLFSTVRIALEQLGVRVFRTINAVVPIRRDALGEITGVGQTDTVTESFIWMEVDPDHVAGRAPEVEARLRGRLEAARAAVQDFGKIRQLVQALAERSRDLAKQRPDHRQAYEDNARFLTWLTEENFVFLGTRHLSRSANKPTEPVGDFGVGSLKDWRGIPIEDAENAVLDAEGLPPFLWIRKSKNESWTYRPGRTDHILVQCYDAAGKPAGIAVIEGLFSFQAVVKARTDIPLLDRTIDRLFTHFGAAKGQHRYRTIRNAFNSLPLEYVFALQPEDVQNIIEQIINVDSDARVQVHISCDEQQKFAFVFVTLPRTHYSEELRSDVRRLLSDAFKASSVDDGVYHGGDEAIAVHYFLTGATGLDRKTEDQLRADIEELALPWGERLMRELTERFDKGKARELHASYAEAFPSRYREDTSVARTVTDIELLESLNDNSGFDCDIYREKGDQQHGVTRLRLYEAQALLLSDILPILDTFGLVVMDEFPSTVQAAGSPERLIATFRLRGVKDADLDLLTRRNRLRAALRAVVLGKMDNEPLNVLLLRADIPWTYVILVRALQNYARQLGMPYTAPAVRDALLFHSDVVRAITEFFRAKFDPTIEGLSAVEVDDKRQALVDRSRRAVEQLLDGVTDLTSDKILRTFYNLVDAAVRTNFYARDPMATAHLVIKFDPSQINSKPEPVPFREIYVHHPLVAAVHLRGSSIARGGIRWSDRTLDFRTEILGLMATQNIKNVVIVPRGAKGGFVLKRAPTDPNERRQHADQMYRIFIGGLLEVTDNLVDGKIVTPKNVLRYDPPDHYLVVAADKGTAHLSDTANALSAQHNFWLGDAFASGGSKGYDHKKEAITARGAWECVKRHFAELGQNPEKDRLKVVGIGDMSGDVFGNGLLLSKSIQLVAAFDHRHVFLDPNPDPEKSWQARKKLFDTPRSSWGDYPTDLISSGGGIFARAAKAIRLSPAVKAVLGIEADSLSGQEVIQAILAAPVDLLWNGGIGTYIKAANETHADAGDTTNDAVRVDAPAVRAKVIAEGGNLGITQAGRIELAARGIRLNTDALDNSAGVDLSDHEVNLKILVQSALARGKLTMADRDRILDEVKPDICRLVLENNWAQSRMVSLDELRSKRDLARFKRGIEFLRHRVPFRRRDLRLPGESALAQRAQRNEGLYRPELSVLASNAKLDFRQELAKDTRLDLEQLTPFLLAYFPAHILDRLRDEVMSHPLALNIARTILSNQIFGDVGCTWLAELTTRTGRGTSDIVAAYLGAADLVGAKSVKEEITALEGKVAAAVEYRMRLLVEDSLESVTSWLLERNEAVTPAFYKVLRESLALLPQLAGADEGSLLQATRQELQAQGVPEKLAQLLAVFEQVDDAIDVAELSQAAGESVERAGRAFYAIGALTAVTPIIRRSLSASGADDLDRPARFAMRAQLRRLRVDMGVHLLRKESDLSNVSVDTATSLAGLRNELQPLISEQLPLSNLVIAATRVLRHQPGR